MKQLYFKIIFFFIFLFSSLHLSAQLRGVITDSLTNEPLMYISVYYEGKGVGTVSNINGKYKIETRRGWNEVTFSAVGYKTKTLKIAPDQKTLNVLMQADDVLLSEVIIKPKKEKYSRKNNPTVDLMRKVVENNKTQVRKVNDHYKYTKYKKVKREHNKITP